MSHCPCYLSAILLASPPALQFSIESWAEAAVVSRCTLPLTGWFLTVAVNSTPHSAGV